MLLWLSAGLPPFLCAAVMKRRAPGSQVVAQTVWMLSLQNPKLGACKFAPVLVGTGGSASGEVWGWDLALLSLSMMGTESAGLAGMLPKQGLLFFGGILSWVSHAPRARSQAVSCCHQHRGRLRFHTLRGEVLLPHRPYLLSLQFWAVVSGQQQRPPHIQLLGNLGNHRLPGHTAGARGRERGRAQLP